MQPLSRRDMLRASAATLGCAMTADVIASPAVEHSFHVDHIIGTSLDVWMRVLNAEEGEGAERAILAEIERLRRIFSLYDPESELSRFNRSMGEFQASDELIEVLSLYEEWHRRTQGALCAELGNEKQPLSPQSRGEGDGRRTLVRASGRTLNLNSIAKGYIIQRAAAVAPCDELLLNLGGDILAVGSTKWAIGVQNPFTPADNAPPLTLLQLQNRAVATSGGYLRPSHIIDPRTGRTAKGVASATVLAADNITANSLATTLCVLKPDEGLRLIATIPNTACIIVADDGRRFVSPGLETFDCAADDEKPTLWPEGHQVTVNIEIPDPDEKRYRRPYVAVWFENADGKQVRTITVWGKEKKYLKDLSDWWKYAHKETEMVKVVTRATRGPGKYTVVWDGKNDKGEPLPQGKYTIRIEVVREFGRHRRQSGVIECGTEVAKLKLENNEETGDTLVEYGKK